jgi:hypothetical protein
MKMLLISHTEDKTKITDEINEKIEELIELLKKYFDKVDNIDEQTEKQICEEIVQFEESLIYNTNGDSEWLYLNIIKNNNINDNNNNK